MAVNSCTAHHHIAPDGSIYNVGSSFGRDPFYVFTKTYPPRAEDREDASQVLRDTSVIGKIPLDEPMLPCYYHSFGMTKDHLVLFESPMRINLDKMLADKSKLVGS